MSDSDREHEEEEQPQQYHGRRIPTMEERRLIPSPPPPPRDTWYRGKMQGFPAEVQLKCRNSLVQEIKSTLQRIGGEDLLQHFKTTPPFGHLLDLRRRGSANTALHELLARELYVPGNEFERIFHVAGRDIRFGAQEFCLVTGLGFGPTTFNPNGRNHIVPSSNLFHTFYGGRKVAIEELLRDFTDASRVIGSVDQYLRAADLLVYYFLILCREKRPFDEWTWTLVEDQDQWARFPWGSWAFQIMCHQLGVAKKDPTEIGGRKNRAAYHLYGPAWAFTLWVYEAIPDLAECCGVRDEPTLLPRLRRWRTWSLHLDFSGFFDNPTLRVHDTLDADRAEEMTYYFQSFLESNDRFSPRFDPSGRHSWKKLPVQERKSKAAREMEKVKDKLKCQDTS
ncbi:hypothetical protein OROMI_010707 [Orobanche minor]